MCSLRFLRAGYMQLHCDLRFHREAYITIITITAIVQPPQNKNLNMPFWVYLRDELLNTGSISKMIKCE